MLRVFICLLTRKIQPPLPQIKPRVRRKNILIIVKGSSTKYSGVWLFNKLVKAHTKREIEHIKHKYAQFVDKKALKYLNTLEDENHFPGARCNQ